MADIRGYTVYINTVSGVDYLIAFANDRTQKQYPVPPSLAEINEALGTSYQTLGMNAGTFAGLWYGCSEIIGSPKLPDDGVDYMTRTYANCPALLTAPSLQKNAKRFMNTFQESGIIVPPVIPKGATGAFDMFFRCVNLKNPASIPENLTYISAMYRECTNMTGEFVIRPTNISLGNRSNVLKDTVKPITIYGDQTLCEAVAATANNGNASWQPWYEPVPAVTDRGQGSYTTADDMTRMVRNGVLAVDSYAPGRMVYHQGDIVREDEWEALVEAAQTIDPTVTMSTHYTNLNKIEKAFDDAL